MRQKLTQGPGEGTEEESSLLRKKFTGRYLSVFKGSSDGTSEASRGFEVGQDARPPALSQYIPGGVGDIAPEDFGRFIRELEAEVDGRASAAEEEARASPPVPSQQQGLV
ncbi:hypothetical protein THAOC_31682, partial [Thalassiosira oceanica]